MQEDQEELYVKYGDQVILRCAIDNKCHYVLSRPDQVIMETQLQMSGSRTFNMYELPQQLILTIFPKLLYEAQKKYFKHSSKILKGPTQDIQNQLLYKRMETEKLYNQSLLKSSKGQKVLYGDIIMLYQPLQQVFLSKPDDQSQNTILCQQMYFQIQPDPLALDIKMGSAVRNFDQFLLVQNDHILKFDGMTLISHLPEVVGLNSNFDHDPNYLTFPAIIENNRIFKFYKAQYKNIQSLTKEQLSQNSIQVLIIPQIQDLDQLHYGDYIRIKYFKSLPKVNESMDKRWRSIKIDEQQQSQSSKGYVTCGVNAIGCFPQVFLQLNEVKNDEKLEKAASIFQIVPESDSQYGQSVNLKVGNKPNLIGYQHLLLRHLLTGQYLRLNPKTKLLELSSELTEKYRQIQESKKKPELQAQKQEIKVSKNQPGIKIYQNLNQQQDEQRVVTQPQLQNDEVFPQQMFQDKKLLFLMKLGNNPTFNRDSMPFTYSATFNIATNDGSAAFEVRINDDAYQEKIATKNVNYNYYSENNFEGILRKQFKEEVLLMMPEVESFQKKLKFNLSQQEKEIIEFFEREEKQQAQGRMKMGHFKSNNDTFLSTFINLNPLKSTFLDILAGEEFSGSNFMFERVQQQEIQQINEILGCIYPIITLAKHPIQMTPLKLKLSNPKFKDAKDLSALFQKWQNQAIQNVTQCVKSLHKLMLWLSDSQENLAMENIVAEPITQRQTLLREIGCIDYIIKILYELHINGLLYEHQDQIMRDEDLYEQEINSLIDAISTFLQLICKSSYENSIYTVQWYFFYKHILLQGQVNNLMRLDILLTQLFQQTDMNITFEFEVSELSKETKFSKYNKHAYNLLIAFCLHTHYRKRDGIQELLTHIFEKNRDTIFAQLKYDGIIQIQMSSKLIDMKNKNEDGSPISGGSLDGNNFSNRQALNDYMISCVRLASELAKSSPSLCLPHIKKIFPFQICTNIIQDSAIQSSTKNHFLELFQNSYMAKHLDPLPIIKFPQYIKILTHIQNKSFLGLVKTSQTEVKLYIFNQKKIQDLYKKVEQRYFSDEDRYVDIWAFISFYISTFWKNKTIFEVKAPDHQFIRQLLMTFNYLLKRGVFIRYLQNPSNFYRMYHQFIEFLKNSIISANLEEKFLKHQLQGDKQQNQQKPQAVREYLFENNYSQKRQTKSQYAKSINWLDELIDIIVLLEKYFQSRIVDQFIEHKDNYTVFDDLQYLQKFATDSKYQNLLFKLKEARKSQYNARSPVKQFEQNDELTSVQLAKILRECSFSRKSLILEYMGELKQTDISLVYFLIELLTFNQTRLSASVTELLWAIYSTKSSFLETLNQTMLLDQKDESEEVQQKSIFNEFSNIYWKIHFALIAFQNSTDQQASKQFESINDALSDILVIFYPDYSAKSDMQLYMEINQLENDERHYQAFEEKGVKSKIRQEQDVPVDNALSKPDIIDIRDLQQPDQVRPQQEVEEEASLKSPKSDQQYLWRMNNSLSIDILTVFQRQKILRYLGFHDLLKKLIELLIEETRGNLFREKDVNISTKNNKGWEIKSEILEKSVLFLIYFVIKNEENQELILQQSLGQQQTGSESFLHEMATVKRKQLQTLVYILFAELFKDNYTILFSMDRFSGETSVLNKLFNKFGSNLQQKNYEPCIYFIQFLQVLLRVKQNDVVQNNELIVNFFKQQKSLSSFAKELGQIITGQYLNRIEQHINGVDKTFLETPRKKSKYDSHGFIDVPIEILFIQEVVRLLEKIGSTRSRIIDEFIKQVLPIKKIGEMITSLDEWYPLKLDVLKYFKVVYLDNVQHLQYDEKIEIKQFVTDILFKQMTVSFVENPNVKRLQYIKLINNSTFNIFGVRTAYSTNELVMSTDYEKSAYMYCISGVIEITKEFLKKVVPKYFQDDQEYFDDNTKSDLTFILPNLFENIDRVKDFIMENPPNQKQLSSMINKKSNRKNKSILLTQRLLSNYQAEDINELSIQIPEDNEESKESILRVVEWIRNIQVGEVAQQLKKQEYTQYEQVVINKWENLIQSKRRKMIDDHLVINERENELGQLVNLIVTLKKDDTNKFKLIVASLIQILSEDSVSSSVKLKSITIIRKLSNYKDNLTVSKSILKDLSELGFTDFLCDLIKGEYNDEQRLEYIKAFVEYIDDSSKEIQASFLQYLQRDLNNQFILSLQNFVKEMFNEIRMSEVSNQERRNPNIERILNYKINACIYVFELFRLGCEDHYLEMQDYLRHQPQAKQPVNFITFTAQVFEKYVEIMNQHNAPLGQKLVDFLIECVQGPCVKNQLELCHQTRILEVIESIIIGQRVNSSHFIRRDIIFANLREKMFLLQLSLMEGNSDQEIPKKISQYFNPQLLIERIELVYWQLIKRIRNTQIQINLEVKLLNRLKTEKDEVANNYGIIQTRDTKETLPNQTLFVEFVEKEPEILKLKTPQQQLRQQVSSIDEKDLEMMVQETFTMYLLLKKLSQYIPEIKSFQEDANTKLKKAMLHYKNQTAQIEIVNMNGKLEKIYFQQPQLMFYLTEESKIEFQQQVGRDSINDKINGLLDSVDKFYMEMVHFMRLRGYGIRYRDTLVLLLRNLCIFIAFLINLLILTDITTHDMSTAIDILGYIVFVMYCIILMIWMTVRMSLEYEKIKKEVSDFIKLNYYKKNQSLSSQDEQIIVYPIRVQFYEGFLKIRKLIFNTYTVYWIGLLILCALGIFYNKLFYGFLLLDIIDHSEILRNVIKSITLNYNQLLMTALLGVLIMYLYAIVAYQSAGFKDQLSYQNAVTSDDPVDSQVCYSSFQCFIFIIHMGLRAGGGVGDILSYPNTHSNQTYYAQRVLYDVSFFLIIIVIGLNIIFGIIIDTFAALRDDKNQKDFDSQNRCFICNLSRTIFEKEGVSFDNHVQKQHNLWNYLSYIIYLRVKEKTQLTGIESYVQKKLEKNDISWLPIEKALDLERLGIETLQITNEKENK